MDHFPPRTCRACGADNLPLARRCGNCGWPLVTAVGARQPRSPAMAVGIGLIALSLVMIVVLTPQLLADFPEPAAPSGAVTVPQAAASVTPKPAPARSPLTSTSPSASTGPIPTASSAPTPRPTPRPSPKATLRPLVRLPVLTSVVKGATSVEYFKVRGRTAVDLLRSTERQATRPCRHRDVLACVELRWEYSIERHLDARAACRVASARGRLTLARVHLPRWTGPARVDRDTLRWWRRVLADYAWHEGRHISILRSWLREFPDHLEGRRCAAVARAIARWEAGVAAAQNAFDDHWRATYRYPPYESTP